MISYEEMVRILKRDSRRYAKRQMTWFRKNESYILNSEKTEEENITKIVNKIQKIMR